MAEHVYTKELREVPPGRPFMMVNYTGIYIRICRSEYSPDLKLVWRGALGQVESDINTGNHLPIVELATGQMMLMSEMKPCCLYPGEYTQR